MPKRVLVIDDSTVDAGLIKELIMEEGLEADVAYTGEEGIKKALELKPDLITLDLMLPDMGGIEVCAKLKEEPSLKETIIIIVSIKDDIEVINRAFHANADDYIIKPPIPEFLIRKIKLYLNEK